MSASPAEVIRLHLDEHGGREEVRVTALMSTWQLERWTEQDVAAVNEQLAQYGVFTMPALRGLSADDSIVVYTPAPPQPPAPAPRYAGVDWDALGKPPRELKVPDRSNRRQVGASAAAGAAGGFVGAAAGIAIWHWLESGAAPVHRDHTGSWFEAGDGSLWFQDLDGDVFSLAENGSWLALDPGGGLWASNGEDLFTWAPDGTMVALEDDGTLTAVSPDGDVMALGEDGGFYLEGDDGSFYTMGGDGEFYGVDEYGQYFSAPDGSGLSGAELAALDLDGAEDADYDDDYDDDYGADDGGGSLFDLF